MNCRNGSITRKTIPNRKNPGESTVQILESRISTVRIVGGVRFGYQKIQIQP